MKAEGGSVTPYAATDAHEDIAETVAHWWSPDSTERRVVEAFFPERAAVLKKYGVERAGPAAPSPTPEAEPAPENPSSTLDTTRESGKVSLTPQPGASPGGGEGRPMTATNETAAADATPKAAYDRIAADLQARWEEAKVKGHSSVERTVVGAYRVDSKPTTAKFGPHEGKQVVKVAWLPVVSGSAHDGGLMLAGADGRDARSEWLPVERLEEWKRNAKELLGAEKIEYMPTDRPADLQPMAITKRLAALAKGGAQ